MNDSAQSTGMLNLRSIDFAGQLSSVLYSDLFHAYDTIGPPVCNEWRRTETQFGIVNVLLGFPLYPETAQFWGNNEPDPSTLSLTRLQVAKGKAW